MRGTELLTVVAAVLTAGQLARAEDTEITPAEAVAWFIDHRQALLVFEPKKAVLQLPLD